MKLSRTRLNFAREFRTPFVARLDRCNAGVGIDLGTTNSLIGSVKDGQVVVIPADDGSVLLPSVVQYRNSDVVVGSAADCTIVEYPSTTFHSVKRIIGLDFNEVEHLQRDLSYSIVQGEEGIAMLKCQTSALGVISPVQVSSMIVEVSKIERSSTCMHVNPK